jgi:hypothetical protein
VSDDTFGALGVLPFCSVMRFLRRVRLSQRRFSFQRANAASLTFASWNQIRECIRRLDAIQHVA